MGEQKTTEKERTEHTGVLEEKIEPVMAEDDRMADHEAAPVKRGIFLRGAPGMHWQAVVFILLAAALLIWYACGDAWPSSQAGPQPGEDEEPAVSSELEETPDEPQPGEESEPAPPEEEPTQQEAPTDAEPTDGEPPSEESGTPALSQQGYSQEALDEVVQKVLDAIITDDMTKRDQARAIFDYARTHISYTGNSDKSDWKVGAYEGLTARRGDCFTYYAVSRAMLTALGIDNLEVQRVGGPTSHYWNLINCGDGWYHFDATPRSSKMPYFVSFMFTDQQAADYTARAGRNYYTFDGSLYPERAGGSAVSAPPAKPAEPAVQEPPATTAPAENTETVEPAPEEAVPEGDSGGQAEPDSGDASDEEAVPGGDAVKTVPEESGGAQENGEAGSPPEQDGTDVE